MPSASGGRGSNSRGERVLLGPSISCAGKASSKGSGLLRYIQEEPLRDAIQLQLNRGEFRHILAKSLFFANWGTFRSSDYEEVMNKASCLSLLSNAVLIWNTVHVARIVDQLRAAGHEVKDEDLARASPLAHAHGRAAYRGA